MSVDILWRPIITTIIKKQALICEFVQDNQSASKKGVSSGPAFSDQLSPG